MSFLIGCKRGVQGQIVSEQLYRDDRKIKPQCLCLEEKSSLRKFSDGSFLFFGAFFIFVYLLSLKRRAANVCLLICVWRCSFLSVPEIFCSQVRQIKTFIGLLGHLKHSIGSQT